LIAISAGVESWSLQKYGIKRGEFAGSSPVPIEQVIRYECIAMGSILLTAIVAAHFLRKTAESVNVHVGYGLCLATLCYGLGPVILAHLLDAIPGLPTWVAFAIGITVTWSTLYHGVALMLKPEQTKGFGLYVFSLVMLTVLTALGHFVATHVLNGKIWA
jgi:uncharacterized membrane protein